jgi:uncharacterized protein YceK
MAAFYPEPAPVYGGVRLAAETIDKANRDMNATGDWAFFQHVNGCWIFPFAVIDIPLSLIADTVLLPYTLPRSFSVKRDLDRMEADRKEADAIYEKCEGQAGAVVDFSAVMQAPQAYSNRVLWSRVRLIRTDPNKPYCHVWLPPVRPNDVTEYRDYFGTGTVHHVKMRENWRTREKYKYFSYFDRDLPWLRFWCSGRISAAEGGVESIDWVLLDVWLTRSFTNLPPARIQ